MVDAVDRTEGARRESIDLMASMAESLKALPQLVEALKGNLCVEKQEPLDKEQQAILLIYSIERPTKTKIAHALGYSNHTALRGMGKFRLAWKAYEIMKSFEPGEYRTTGQRRNGRELHADDGTEG